MRRGQLSSAQLSAAQPARSNLCFSALTPTLTLTRLQPVLLGALDLCKAAALLAGEADGQRKPLRARQRLRRLCAPARGAPDGGRRAAERADAWRARQEAAHPQRRRLLAQQPDELLGARE
eukprot:scaffold32564_cov60-Phaeocystis_antarctica.AAC.1